MTFFRLSLTSAFFIGSFAKYILNMYQENIQVPAATEMTMKKFVTILKPLMNFPSGDEAAKAHDGKAKTNMVDNTVI